MRRTAAPYNQYIGFDDRLFMLLGIPIITLFASMVFANVPMKEFFSNFWFYYFDGIFFTASYWLFSRVLLIQLRKRIPQLGRTLVRVALQFSLAFLVYPLIGMIVRGILLKVSDSTCYHLVDEQANLLGLLTTYVLTFLIVAIYEAVYFFKQYRAVIVSQEQLKTEHANTQLTSLRNQVNPHFLFNSLNTLKSLIPSPADDAHRYLGKLSDFYRYSVSEKEEMLVSVDRELEMLQLYIDLVQERYGKGLEVSIEIDVAPTDRILPMSLQLLVENAVKHNIVSKSAPLRIRIFSTAQYVVVENVVQRRITETDSTGMGLENIKERYGFVTEKQVIVVEENELFSVSLPLIVR